MKYSFGWFTKPSGQVVVQITEHLHEGWFPDLFAAKFAAAQFFADRSVLFEVRRLSHATR